MSSVPFWFGAGHVGRHRMLEVGKHTHDQEFRRRQEPMSNKNGRTAAQGSCSGIGQGPRDVSLYKV
jgi:hypothetical protein